MEHTKHIWRAVLIFLSLGIAGIVVRHFLVPSSFGKEGFYRYDSLGEFMALPLVHGSPTSCKKCHEDEFSTRAEGTHATVSCEVCHMPLFAGHVEENAETQKLEVIGPMPIDKDRALCENCHRKLRARPDDMPQVEPAVHLFEQAGLEIGDPDADAVDICSECHDPHSPAI